MKKPLLYIGSVLIFILAAVAFVFVPAKAGNLGSNNSVVFGKYDNKPIELKPGTDFANAVNNISNYYQNNGVTIDNSNYFYIYNYAFDSAVQSMAAKIEVAKTGYEPSKKEISRQMLKLPYFLDNNGKYDPKIASLYSTEQKEELRRNIKAQLIQSRFNEDLFGSADKVGENTLFGLKSQDSEIEFLSKIGETSRTFNIISFDKSKYPESEIRNFANENKNLFEKLDLSAITFADETTAKKVQKQISNNEIKFEDAVTEEYSEKHYTDNAGKVNAPYFYQVKGFLENADSIDSIKNLSKGSYSDIIKTTNGYTIFRKDGDSTVADFNDANMLDVVKKYITSNESSKIEDFYINEAKNFYAKAIIEGFENIDVSSIEGAEKFYDISFPLNYGGASIASKLPTDTVKPLASASNNENFWKKAFSLKVDSYSEPIVLGNYIVVLKYTGETSTAIDDAKKSSVKTEIASYDQSSAQNVLLNSDKVQKDIWSAYAKLHMSK